jgi:hypothetical protein
MSIHRTTYFLFAFLFLLSACGTGTESASTPASARSTDNPPTETQTPPYLTDTPPAPTADPTLFGAIGINEIQAYALESVADAIFTRTMDSFKASGGIQDYQILRLTIFSAGNGGLIAEITFNVRTTDPAWFAEGGTPAADDWIMDKCYRFDFVTTETEYQLKNRRMCN